MKEFTNLAQLRLAKLRAGQTIYVKGHTTEGDGGGGDFWLDTSDTTTADDNGINIVDSQSPRVGTWKRLYSGLVDVRWFGAGAVGAAPAIEAAWAVSNKIDLAGGAYDAPGLVLDGNETYTKKVIRGGGAVITGATHYITGLFNCEMSGVHFDSSDYLYIQGLRYCNLESVETNDVRWGKYTATGKASWSTYWNNFTQCRFDECEFTTSVTDANFNSNTFNVCEWRESVSNTSLGALWTFLETVNNNGVFVSNTFNGCDVSYIPVINMVTEYDFSAVTFNGGYIDTGTAWYKAGSFKIKELNTLGLRNPSGVIANETPVADIYMTTGSSTPRKQLPISALSLFKTNPTQVVGTTNVVVDSIPLPHDGFYSISGIFSDTAGVGFGATKFTNKTTLFEKFGVFATADGVSTYTFEAARGDEIELLIDGDTGADVDILALSLTAGAGNYGAIQYSKLYVLPENETAVNAPNTVATDLIVFTAATFTTGFYDVTITTKNPVTGGGGEVISMTIAFASGGSAVNATLVEVSRAAVNGVGGTSDDSGVLAVAISNSGLTFTLAGTLSGLTSGSVDVETKVRLVE